MAEMYGLIGQGDNTLDANDLAILEEVAGLEIKFDGYNSDSKSLVEAGITSINISDINQTTKTVNFDGKGNDLTTQEGATFTTDDGQEHEYADIWHKKIK